LINTGAGDFIWQDASKTGLNLRGELRDIVELKSKGKTCLLFLQNNDYPALFKLNEQPGKILSYLQTK
ncbi:MAG TPA: hypothetical protein VL095_01810, partial [Flavisolibacter sp.]|nr:hypothetical protein [Flavisolibacter sp.]